MLKQQVCWFAGQVSQTCLPDQGQTAGYVMAGAGDFSLRDVDAILYALTEFINPERPTTEPYSSPDGKYIGRVYVLPGTVPSPRRTFPHDIMALDFISADDAREYASHVLDDGSGMSWMLEGDYVQGRDRIDTSVHWFRRGSAVIRYTGVSAEIMELLENTCGAQFAGSSIPSG
jgi:hypothetical protein